jgi:ABC-type Mn2+/Zn2+ transport system permease subunit
MLTEAFMQRALLAALILGPLCGLLGVFVTARRMAFFSDTLAHSALAGVAAGFLVGFEEPTIPVLFFCGMVAVAMLWLQEKTELLTDTIMAVLLSASVAIGVLLLSLQPRRWADLDKYLFGDILSVGWTDIGFAAGLAAVVAILVFARLNALTLLSSHPDLAHVCGISVRRMNYAFVLLLTVTVALSIRLLGIVLVTSLIVVPPATARNLARNLRQQIVLSITLGWLGAGIGVLVSYPLNLPCGPSITLTLTALFLLSVVVARLRRDTPTTATTATPPQAPLP